MNSLKDKTALLLAGGLGTRLRPVVSDKPKVLAETKGRPFLEKLLEQLTHFEVGTAVICTGYMGEYVQNTLGERYKTLQLYYSHETNPLGTAGAIRNASSLLETSPVLVMNGDSFCDVELNKFYRHHLERQAVASIVLVKVEESGRYGQVTMNDQDEITRFTEKGTRTAAGWVSAGIYLLNRAVIDSIPAGQAVSLEQDIFPQWIGRRLVGYRGDKRFIDIGTPESYGMAEAFFSRR